jgi:hypothetical protein
VLTGSIAADEPLKLAALRARHAAAGRSVPGDTELAARGRLPLLLAAAAAAASAARLLTARHAASRCLAMRASVTGAS